MREIFGLLLAGSFGCLMGCSEIVRPVETSTSTTIDVVGEPSDPSNDPAGTSDILGSAATITDVSDTVADLNLPLTNPEETREETDSSILDVSDPDVAGSQPTGVAEPLKTSHRDANKVK